MAEVKKTFTAYRAAKIAQLSHSMVNYLCRTRLLVPTGPYRPVRGKKRKYSFGDVVVLRAIGKLLQHGVSVLRMKTALNNLRERHPEITAKSLPASHLFTDGRDVLFREGRDVVRDLNTGQYAFAFILELSHIQKEVVKKSADYREPLNLRLKRRYGT